MSKKKHKKHNDISAWAWTPPINEEEEETPPVSWGTNWKTTICEHTGDENILILPGGRVLAGAGYSEIDWTLPDLTLVINASAMYSEAAHFVKGTYGMSNELQKSWLDLNTTLKKIPQVNLDWSDRTAPAHTGLAFWDGMISLLPPGRTIFCCMAGHGRTGTALASLLIAAEGHDARSAISVVRAVYCSKAIETTAQEQYLKSLEQEAREAGRVVESDIMPEADWEKNEAREANEALDRMETERKFKD